MKTLSETQRQALTDQVLAKQRLAALERLSKTFLDVGEKLSVVGHIVGPDRVDGTTPFGNGSDEVFGVGTLLGIGGSLLSGVHTLIGISNNYGAAALIRQIVEVEYLSSAIAAGNSDAEKWLRSDRKARLQEFSPAQLRKRTNGLFRSEDYHEHCELGGHPTPRGRILLKDNEAAGALLCNDTLGHGLRAWFSILGWAEEHSIGRRLVVEDEERDRPINEWVSNDPLSSLNGFPFEQH